MEKSWLIWCNDNYGWHSQIEVSANIISTVTKFPADALLYTYDQAMDICETANLSNMDKVPCKSMVHRSNIKELQNTLDKELKTIY